MRGELTWILTAVTDTIASQTMPIELFTKFFRNDHTVAAVSRNFLVADRIMRSYCCTPQSIPQFPKTHDHPLWETWDLVVDHVLSQLPDIYFGRRDYIPSTFFADHLVSFETWLKMAPDGSNPKECLQYLPTILHIILGNQYRMEALDLLDKFLSLGPWAVKEAVAISFVNYMFKFLGVPSYVSYRIAQVVCISSWRS